jgi:GNAT superfamily N-acetyltransferase
MSDELGAEGDIETRPVSKATLADLDRFSERHGKFRYCSCMRWRLTSTEFRESSKEDRISALSGLVRRDVPVGVLAYLGSEPIGWCSVAPRTTYAALERYRKLERVDGLAVWSVVCFFIDRHHRGRGVAAALLRGSVRYAHEQGAEAVEGYPRPPGSGLYGYMGSIAVFRDAGFRDVTPPGRERPVMRWFPPAG